jgi:WD40 repeat protein/predicted Ser/Thr protein kinase
MNSELPVVFSAVADLSVDDRLRYYADHGVEATARLELEELLAHDAGGDDSLLQIVGMAARAALHGDASGMRCGAFRLVRVLGTGGMGVVYLGERDDGEVAQRAAVKLMHPGWSQLQRERFLREREILAALTHPNIAHLLDVGHLKDGQPYLAMEYVEGQRIDEYCRGLGPRQKIELFLKVCRAVEYLHANFVLHRDLKPSNILVTALGEPKLLDFGIAKMLDLQRQITVTEARMLTPDYASPEQLHGGTLGPVSDIYSLGAVLYFLLTGKTAGATEAGELPVEIRGDIELVLQIAMRPDPQDRYPTVAALSDDLRACLESRPVRARRRDWIYRIRRFARRQPASVALGGALMAAVAVAGGLWYQQTRPVTTAQNLRVTRLTSNTPELPIDGAAISPDGKLVAYTDALGIHIQNLVSGGTQLLPGTSGHMLVQWGRDGAELQTQTVDKTGAVAGAVISAADGSVRRVAAGFAPYTLSPDGTRRARAVDPAHLTVEDANGENARDVWMPPGRSLQEFAWSPDGQHIAVVSEDSAASMLETVDVATRKRETRIAPEKKLMISALAWPNPHRIVVGIREAARGANTPGTSNLWELRLRAPENGSLRRLTSWTDFPLRSGSLTTDGKKLTFIRSFRQRDVYIADVDLTRRRMGAPRRLTLDLGDDYPTAWTPDSKAVLFTSDRNGPSTIFRQHLDQPTAEQVVFGPSNQIIARSSPDGKWILFASREGDKRGVMRAPMEGGKAQLLFETPDVIGLRCSRTGPCTVTERRDGVVFVSEIDPVKGTKVREIYRDTAIKFAGPDLSPDGKWLATPSGMTIVLRSFATGAVIREVPVQGATPAAKLVNLDYAPDGKGFYASLRTPTEMRQLYIDLAGRASVLWRQAGRSQVWGIPSPNGRHLAMAVYTDDSNVYTINDF